jgi:hypothetical protein
MDEHFADLFSRYEALAPEHALEPVARQESAGELAVARSAVLGS